MDVLLVIDMQNDFIDGALGTPEAVAVVPKIRARLEQFDGAVYFTRDTHEADYLKTLEGKNLPVEHCIRGTHGWEIHPALAEFVQSPPIDKNAFGSAELGEVLRLLDEECGVDSVTLVGVCTDVCVISNALIAKAFLPNTPVIVEASLCAATTPEAHEVALKAMGLSQVDIRC